MLRRRLFGLATYFNEEVFMSLSGFQSIGIAGNGRLARHMHFYLSHYLSPSTSCLTSWSRKTHGAQDPYGLETLKDCSVIWVLLSDSAIDGFVEKLKSQDPRYAEKTFIHCSGALLSSQALGFHPLMTFGEKLYEPAFYPTIPFIGERGQARLLDIFPELSNPEFQIEGRDKALYHALCVMSGNFSVLLWQKLFQDFEQRLNIPPECALPYLKKITENLEQNFRLALSGPLQRKDYSTLEKNRAALAADPFQKIYTAFVETFAQESTPK